MSLRSRTRFGLLAVVVLAMLLPLAGAQLPGVPTPPSTPGAPTPPSSPIGTSDGLDIHDGPITILGPPTNPTFVAIEDAQGATALVYSVDSEGRARLDVAGENAVTDATLVRLEGDPTGDAFRLVIRDAQGGEHVVDIDRNALDAAAAGLPPAPEIPNAPLDLPIEIARPPTWPGAPQQPYFLHIQDASNNILSASQLTGTSFVQKSGSHRAVLQIPLAQNEWDRWFMTARRDGQNAAMNVSFATAHTTDNALVLAATFTPSLLSPNEGDRIGFTITYEKRHSPLIVQRFVEDEGYRFRVDGAAPSVYVTSPPDALDFRFPVSWGGSDALSGLGAFRIETREAGAAQWRHWLTTPETTAIFQGDWGKTYEFRARAYDRVGNPSSEALAATAVATQPTGTDDVNDAPTARILTPRAGSQVSGVVPITWTATDPDDDRVSVRLELSDDEGESWRLLYAGPGDSASWDTLSEADGPGYELRLTVSDGTQTASHSASALTVRNVVLPAPPAGSDPRTPAAPGATPTAGGTGTQPGQTTDGDEPVTPASDEPGDEKTPLPLAIVLAALGLAAIAGRRKRA